MKKLFESPKVEIIAFQFEDLLTVKPSGGTGLPGPDLGPDEGPFVPAGQ